MMENSRTAAKTNMTVTAFLGCRLSSTRPIQLESGSTPSRATAKRSREEATTAILVFYGAVRCDAINISMRPWGKKTRAHHDETDHGDDGHEDARSFTQSERVELYERLRGIEREERVQVRNAEQEEDGGEESQHAGGD